MAECHPVGFRWVMEAKNRGATIIHVDPRFSRTSAVADLHVPIRAGHRHRVPRRDHPPHPRGGAVLQGVRPPLHERRHDRGREIPRRRGRRRALQRLRLRARTSTSGTPGATRAWTGPCPRRATRRSTRRRARAARRASTRAARRCSRGRPDPTLQHPRCVFQILKRHFARYTPEVVEETCGIPRALFLQVAETLCKNSGRERTGAFCYAVGWTQHSIGVQYIRTAAILQLLLGNMGRPGGGIMALRGHTSIQGSTDIPTLFDLLPGYLPMPHASLPDRGLRGVRQRTTPRRPAGGASSPSTPSRSRRPGSATRRRGRTTGSSTPCRASPATTPTW